MKEKTVYKKAREADEKESTLYSKARKGGQKKPKDGKKPMMKGCK